MTNATDDSLLQIATYGKEGLQRVKEANFLEPQEVAALNTMMGELQDTFEKKQIWRTETEMRVSVLNDIKFPTPAAKYWQAVREQAVFFGELLNTSFEYRKNEILIRKLEQCITNKKDTKGTDLDEFEIELMKVDLDAALFRRKNFQAEGRDRMRELKLWSKIKGELQEVAQFDTENPDTHQLLSYAKRYLQQALVVLQKADTSAPDAINILGLLRTSLRACKSRGDDVLKEALSVLPLPARIPFLNQAVPGLADELGLVNAPEAPKEINQG